ncbi:hypothetical protein CHUAL_006969 [Chamberlinius hualienensis]
MGANNGRLHDSERRVNSSFSHDSDFSLSATSVEYNTASFNDTESDSAKGDGENYAVGGAVCQQNSNSGSSSSSVDGYLRGDFHHNNYHHLIPSHHYQLGLEAPTIYPPQPHHYNNSHLQPAIVRCPNNRRLPPAETHQHEVGSGCGCSCSSAVNHRMSPRVYVNKPPKPTPVTSSEIVTPGLSSARSSPGPDLGYHTLISREILSQTGVNGNVGIDCTQIPIAQEVTYNSRRFTNPSPLSCCWDTGQLLTSYKGKKLPKSSPFDKLTDDVLLKVFSYLSTNQLCTCARVCRRWYFLTWEPQLWTTIEMTGANVPVDRALRTIFQLLCRDSPSVCLTVEKIVLSGCIKLTDKGLIAIAQHCPELRHVELKGCQSLTNDGLLELVSNCHNIEYLDLTGCNLINCIDSHRCLSTSSSGGEMDSNRSGINLDSSLLQLPSRQLFIQYLDLTDCHSLEDPGLKVMVRNCPQLSHLYLRRCIRITDVGMKYVASYCVTLRELSVSDCSQLTDFGLYELAKLGPNLRYMSVAKCERMSDAGIKQIARHCYKLRYLNCRGCEAVSDDSLTVLARSCPRLRALDVGKCDITDYGLKLLSENCLNLKKLSVKSCDMVTDKGVQSIAYYCRGLQQLNIQDCQITIEGYRTVKKFCKRCIIEHTNPGFY